jgi:hypothetical protein
MVVVVSDFLSPITLFLSSLAYSLTGSLPSQHGGGEEGRRGGGNERLGADADNGGGGVLRYESEWTEKENCSGLVRKKKGVI